MSAIMKNHKIVSGMVPTGPGAYCQLQTPHKFGSCCLMLLTEIEICSLAIMKNHKIGCHTVPPGPRVYCQLPTNIVDRNQNFHIGSFTCTIDETPEPLLEKLYLCMKSITILSRGLVVTQILKCFIPEGIIKAAYIPLR